MIGQKIRAARLEKKLTQEQLAGTDLTKSYISDVERGRRNPRRVTLKVLARRLDKSLSYFIEGAAEDREAEVFLQLGLAHLHAGSTKSAIASLERAQDLALQESAEALQAQIELALAMTDQSLGCFQQAQYRLDRCLKIFIRTSDAGSLAAAHCCLGSIKLGAGDPASAVWAFQAGLQHCEHPTRDPFLRSQLYLGIGLAHRKLGSIRAAREAFSQALEAAHPFQDQFRVASWHLDGADAAAEGGHFEEAFEHIGKAGAIHEAFVHKRRLAEIHERLAEIEGEEGNWEEAECHHRWSVTLNGAASNLPGMAQALSNLAEVLLERVSPEAARAVCKVALGLLHGEVDHQERAHVLRVLGTLSRIAGRREEAKAVLNESLALLGEAGHKDNVRLVRQELALLALERGDIEEARQHLQMLQKM
jgi:tetratricopeptide (TPR) repeat protein